MSISLATIATKVRYLINDLEEQATDVYEYTTDDTFTLFNSNVNSIELVTVNDSESGVTYTSSADLVRLTITSSLSVGDSISITYKYYPNYSLTEIKGRIRSALIHISNMGYEEFNEESGELIYPEPTIREQNLISIVSSLLICPDNETIRLPDITISRSNNKSTIDKIREVVAIFKRDSTGLFFLG